MTYYCNAGMIKLLVQLDIYVALAAQEPQAGQHLFIEMRLDIGELLFFNGRDFFEQDGIVVNDGLIQGIEKLDDLQVFVGGISFDIELEIPFL